MTEGGGGPAVDLRLLRYFVAVAEERHFGRAAQRLYISQPALSRQVRLLEDAVGLALFHRGERPVALTDAGHQLLPRAREALAAAQRFADAGGELRRAQRARLRLGFVGQAVNELTPRLLRAFAEQHPEVAVQLRQSDLRDLSAGLRDGAVDLAMVRLPIDTTGLCLQPVLREPRAAVLPDDHPLAGHATLSVRQLLDLPWVHAATSDPAYQHFALALGQRGGTPPVLGPVVSSIDEYLEAVLAGQGVGLAPLSASRYYRRPGLTYVPVPDAEPSVVALAWLDRPGHPVAPGAAFLALARRLVPPG